MLYIKRGVLYCLIFLSLIGLTACGNGGTPIENPNGFYGQLQATPTVGLTFNTTQLQNWFDGPDGICSGVSNLESLAGEEVCTGNQNYIKANPSIFGAMPDNNTRKFVTDNPLGIESVNLYQVIYTSPSPTFSLGDSTLVEKMSGTLIIPQIAPNKIKGVVLFFHPTILSKSEVPSLFEPVTIGYDQDFLMSAIYAAQGYIVEAPDYPGLGVDAGIVHPYVVLAEPNAQSGIYLLQAASNFLHQQGVTQNLPLYISSYSEGGAYALWASKLAQTSLASVISASNLRLTRTVGVSGAYDLSGQMLPFAFSNVNNSWESSINPYFASPGGEYAESGPAGDVFKAKNALAVMTPTLSRPAIAAYMMAAYLYYNAPTDGNYIGMNQTPFPQMTSCLDVQDYLAGNTGTETCFINGVNYNLIQMFSESSPSLTSGAISSQILSSAIGASNYFIGNYTSESLIGAVFNGYRNNSVASFINPIIQTLPLSEPIIQDQDIYNWTTTSPLSLVYMHFDSIVTNMDSKEALNLVESVPENVTANSASGMVTGIEVDNTKIFTAKVDLKGVPLKVFIDHGDAEPILQLVALHQIESGS